jgi:Flp pilus assembly protein TadD
MIPCPCCRASNAAGPACRRCKADLSPLFALEARRDFLLADARRLAADGRFADALTVADEAASLRSGDDARTLRAALLLLTGDFPAAWKAADPRAAGGRFD